MPPQACVSCLYLGVKGEIGLAYRFEREDDEGTLFRKQSDLVSLDGIDLALEILPALQALA